MRICCVVCIWIFLTEIRSSSTDEIETHGYAGKHVTISCQQSWAWSNRKYFCRDPCQDTDVLVSSDRPIKGRFNLKYLEKGKFTVTITDLQESDSGIYWCGVDRVGADTYEKVNLRVSKDTSTKVDTTRPLSTSTRKQESPFATSRGTSRSSTLEYTTCSPSVTVSSVSVNISLYAAGGLIAVVILVCGLVAVYHYKKIVKKTEDLVLVTPVDHNNGTVEEVINLYVNDVQGTRNSKQMKSKKLEPEVPKNQSLSVYENVELNTGQSDIIYENI